MKKYIFFRIQDEDENEPPTNERLVSNKNMLKNESRNILWDNRPIPICDKDQWRPGGKI